MFVVQWHIVINCELQVALELLCTVVKGQQVYVECKNRPLVRLLVTVLTALRDGEANTAGNTDYSVDGTSDDADQQTSSATNDCK